MTPEENEMLQDLLGRVRQTRLAEKDPDAQAAIDRAIGSNPDSHYILAQMVLVQKIALIEAKLQSEQLQQKVAGLQQHLQERPVQPARTTSFLGSLLGKEDSRGPSPLTFQPVASSAVQIPFPPVSAPPDPPPYQHPLAAPPAQPVQGYATVPGGFNPYGGGGVGGAGFLRTAATTAAGVAAGALAFEGVESMLHGGRGYGGLGGGFAGGAPVEENINNYYEGTGGAPVHHPLDAAIDRPDLMTPGQDPHLVAASYEPSGRDNTPSYQPAGYDTSSAALGGEGLSEYERPNSYPAGIAAVQDRPADLNSGDGVGADPGDRDLTADSPDDGVPAATALDAPFDDSPSEEPGGFGNDAADAFGGDVYDGGGASAV